MGLVVRFEFSEARRLSRSSFAVMSPSAVDSDPLGPLVHVSSPAPFYQYSQCRALGADRVEALIQFSTPPPPPPHSRLPPCRDEFLLRPAVHVITVVTAR